MYYDEKKGRYVIAGEEDSDDDEPPPPPPGLGAASKQNAAGDASEAKQDQAKDGASNAEQPSGLDSLTAPGFAGALGNRRGRGRGRGGAAGQGRGRGRAMARFPQTFDPSQLQETAMPPSLKNENQ